ncbi:MAG: HD domain-containing phosphohydrolase [Aeromonas sobria]|uniref:response regulator n=1 Tax=Aeromonas sobria TaxID=646 RepID=UPI003F2DC169
MEHLALDAVRPVVLVVDDDTGTLNLMNALLRGRYSIKLATTGRKALEIARADTLPDLVLLDIMMPDLDGHEVCRQLKADPQTSEIPVIFLTAMAQTEDERRGFALGAADYITKPISPPILLARIDTHLMLKRAADQLRVSRHQLAFQHVGQPTPHHALAQGAIMLLATFAEQRALEVQSHASYTQSCLRRLACQLANQSHYRDALAGLDVELLCQAALLRDVGMLSVPEAAQCSSAPLTASERKQIVRHPEWGEVTIARLARLVEESVAAENLVEARCADNRTNGPLIGFDLARILARHHHERWDGTGYPDGLAGEDIPLVARLMAIVDVYVALLSERPYRPPFSREEALVLMMAGRGSQFDPLLLDYFVALAPTLPSPAGLVD